MSKVKLPEPVAYRWRAPIVDFDGRQYGESDWKFGTEKGGHPWWTRDSLITTTQANAYADAKVREALEDAERTVMALHSKAVKDRVPSDEDEEGWNASCADRAIALGEAVLAIRALIPSTPT